MSLYKKKTLSKTRKNSSRSSHNMRGGLTVKERIALFEGKSSTNYNIPTNQNKSRSRTRSRSRSRSKNSSGSSSEEYIPSNNNITSFNLETSNSNPRESNTNNSFMHPVNFPIPQKTLLSSSNKKSNGSNGSYEKCENAPPNVNPKKFNYDTCECLEPRGKNTFDYSKCTWYKNMAGNLKLEKQYIKNSNGKLVQAKQDPKDGRFWIDLSGKRVYNYAEIYKNY